MVVSRKASNLGFLPYRATETNFALLPGDGSSCACLGGYLDFTRQDANAGVLCGVDTSLVGQIDLTIQSLEKLQRQLAVADCQVSEQLKFGVWLDEMTKFCSGTACPALESPNLFSFLSANKAFTLNLERSLSSFRQQQ